MVAPAPTIQTDDYELVCHKLKELSALESINGLLGWDEMVMMPKGAADSRSKQKTALAGVLYERKVDKDLGAALERLNGKKAELDTIQSAVVRDALRDYRRAAALSEELAKEKAELESRGYQAWAEARSTNDWSKFAPVLEEWLVHTKEVCRRIDSSLHPYDVCLDTFEKGLTMKRCDEVFAQVKEALIPLLTKLRASPHQVSDAWLMKEGEEGYDVKKQAELCNQLAVELGFNLDHGRLDVSVHPFTGGAHPTDVRMTTRFKPHDVMEGITGAIHETGHSLYEQGRNLTLDGLPANQALSMGIHESQSLLWERSVGLSREYCSYLLPKLRATFPDAFPTDKTADELYAAINKIKVPSFIRVEADEVSYPLHIIIRYELERALLSGDLAVADVPKQWNAKYEEYLGKAPPTDAQGCLQDVHWSMGALGYFPTYSLGAMAACQIFEAAEKALPGLKQDIAVGKFDNLRQWLNQNIHQVGSVPASGDVLLEQATGKVLDPMVFLNHITSKYSALYKL